MKNYLKYMIIGLTLFFVAFTNIKAEKITYFNCKYQSGDAKNVYNLSIGQDGKSWFANGNFTKLDGKNSSKKYNISNFVSATNYYLELFISNMCPSQLYLKGKKVYLNSSSLKNYTELDLVNSISDNINNYNNLMSSRGSYSCEYKFGDDKVSTLVSNDYAGAIYNKTGNYVSNGSCPETAYMVCQKGSKTNCYYSYSSSKPVTCNNADCYKLPTGNQDTLGSDKPSKIVEYQMIYNELSVGTESYGDTLTFNVKYDKNNDIFTQQSLSTSKSSQIGLAIIGDVASFKMGVLDPIVNSDRFPEKFYCGNVKSANISLKSNATLIINYPDGIICSTESSTFIDPSKLSMYGIESFETTGNDSDDDEPDNYIGDCSDIPETMALIKQIYTLLRYLIPVMVIVLSIVDFLKVLLNGEEKVYKESWTKFVKRIVIGIIILVIPIILSFIIDLSGVIGIIGIEDNNIFCIFG